MKEGFKKMKNYNIALNSTYGFRHLEPLPTEEELNNYYSQKYFEELETKNKADTIRRTMSENEEKQAEIEWLSKTLWLDISDTVDKFFSNTNQRLLLDIGCGIGSFAYYMKNIGWDVVGIEPSLKAANMARSLGITIHPNLINFLKETNQRFNVISLLNVLEHVNDPVNMLQSIRPLLAKEGIMVIRVPNDFSSLQEYAQKKIGGKPWWIAIPDHVNYFDFHSITNLVEAMDLQVIELLTDFPMEIFLLFGDIYVGNPQVGNICHKKRISFELSLPTEFRRKLYKHLASEGIGRNCLIFAKALDNQ